MGTRKLCRSLTWQPANTQLICAPALPGTRSLFLQELHSAVQTRPRSKHRGIPSEPCSPLPPSQVIGVFLFLSPFPGISPCSSHGSSPGGSMEDLQLLDSLYPALLRQDPAGFSLQRLLGCCKTQGSGRMQKRQRWCLIFYFASRFLFDGDGDRARGTAGVGKVEKQGEKSRKQPR